MAGKQQAFRIGKTILKNPIITASGTFGFGGELKSLIDVNEFGGFIPKTITLLPREGNPPPRVYDLGFGFLNSIGLNNPGLDVFIKEHIPFLEKLKTKVFISIYGENLGEWKKLILSLDKHRIAGFELNLSCPNVQGGIISADKNKVFNLVSSLRGLTKKTLIAKLSFSPKLKEISLSAEKAGADAVCLINTLPAMAVDKRTHKPVLGNITGGLSGPCIKPVALRAVYEVSREVKISVIGCGGIMSSGDVKEFLSAGACAVEIGTANLVSPSASLKIIKELNKNMWDVRRPISDTKTAETA